MILGPLLIFIGFDRNQNAKKKKKKKNRNTYKSSPQKPYAVWGWDFIEVLTILAVTGYKMGSLKYGQLSVVVCLLASTHSNNISSESTGPIASKFHLYVTS